jgi:hypothetical protein
MANLFIGIAFPWTVLDLFYLQNLSSLPKEQGKVSPLWLVPLDDPSYYASC